MRRHYVAALYMTGAAGAFFFSDFITKQLSESGREVSQVLVGRTFFSLLFITIIMISTRRQHGALGLTFQFFPLLRAVMWVVTVIFYALAFKYGNMAPVYIVSYLFPVFVIIFDVYLTRRGVPHTKILALAIMFVGAAGFNYRAVVELLTTPAPPSRSLLYAMALTFSYAGYFITTDVCQKRIYPPGSVVQMTFSLFLAGLIGLALISVPDAVKDGVPPVPWQELILLAISGIFAFIGILLGAKALQFDTPSNVAPYDYLGVIVALPVDYFAFGAPGDIIQIVALLVLLFGAFRFSQYA